LPNRKLANNRFVADYPSKVDSEGVQPGKLVKIQATGVGKIAVESKLGLSFNLEARLGCYRAVAENGR